MVAPLVKSITRSKAHAFYIRNAHRRRPCASPLRCCINLKGNNHFYINAPRIERAQCLWNEHLQVKRVYKPSPEFKYSRQALFLRSAIIGLPKTSNLYLLLIKAIPLASRVSDRLAAWDGHCNDFCLVKSQHSAGLVAMILSVRTVGWILNGSHHR